MPELASLLPLVGIALLFWFLLIRPTQRRQRELRQMQASLDVDAEVMLTSGIYGTVRSLVDDRVSLEIAPGVTVQAARGAVASVVTPAEHLETHPDESDGYDNDGYDNDADDNDTDADDTAPTGEER